MFKSYINVNRTGKAIDAGSSTPPAAYPRGCEIAPMSEALLEQPDGDVYLMSWSPVSPEFITPQQYLDGAGGVTKYPSAGVYALVCHTDPDRPNVKVVHYLMLVQGISAPVTSSNGEQIRTLYASLMACPGQGGIYENIYMALFLRIPKDGSPLPSSSTIFRPSYDKMYWPGEGAAYSVKWTCDIGKESLICTAGDDSYSYISTYKAAMAPVLRLGMSQSANCCYVHLSFDTADESGTLLCRIFSLVAAASVGEGQPTTLYWLGLAYNAENGTVGYGIIAGNDVTNVLPQISTPCSVISYSLFTTTERDGSTS